MIRAAIVLALAASSCAALHWVPLPKEAELHRVKTVDGWEIALVRYRPVGAQTGRPVVLVHGISANARNMDLDEGHSMARWFAAHGREAWTVSLRGGGDSDCADPDKGRAAGFAFDVYWEQDLPAVIAFVKQVSGVDAVDFVGHSMGGMALYAYLAEGGQGIHAAATLGTPSRLDWGMGFEGVLFGASRLIAGWTVPSSFGAHAAVPLVGVTENDPIKSLLYSSENTTVETWQRLMAYGTSDISAGVAAQLLAGIQSGAFTCAEGNHDFRKGLAKVTAPVLVVAGRLDRVAMTPAVYDGYRALGGPKEWLLISRANGAVAEYGHLDLVIGDRAATEVWTPVLDFLNRQEHKEPR
jgi:pimeloyl-ACP methyl ester carboxylesterase